MSNTLQQKEEMIRLGVEEARQLCEKLNTVELLHENKHAELTVRLHLYYMPRPIRFSFNILHIRSFGCGWHYVAMLFRRNYAAAFDRFR